LSPGAGQAVCLAFEARQESCRSAYGLTSFLDTSRFVITQVDLLLNSNALNAIASERTFCACV